MLKLIIPIILHLSMITTKTDSSDIDLFEQDLFKDIILETIEEFVHDVGHDTVDYYIPFQIEGCNSSSKASDSVQINFCTSF